MKTFIIGATLMATTLTPANVSAAPQYDLSKLLNNNGYNSLTLGINQPKTETILIKPKDEPKPETKKVEPPKPEPVVYTVVDGDNLSKIGTQFNVEWQRLWAKNTNLTNPDLIYVGDKLTIPTPDEVLSRELPTTSLPVQTPGVSPQAQPQYTYDASNTYAPGNCTWYVKNRRGASIPNTLGNANTWFARAQAAGMSTGYTPRAGAVGTTTAGSLGHVVYVESVNGDGTVNISEMNYGGLYNMNYRTVSASEFAYIY